MNSIKKLNPHSFVQRDFYWVAEYLNGTLYPEFDFNTHENNDFETINKNMLIRFGYIGAGYRFYFDTPTGVFSIADNDFSMSYVTDDYEYNLTQNDCLYNDIISFKRMYADANFSGQPSIGNVSSYNFGYKNKFNVNGVNFHFKPIMHIPYGQPAYFTIWIVSDKDLNGRIVIKRNGLKYREFECPLEANVGGELTWKIEM